MIQAIRSVVVLVALGATFAMAPAAVAATIPVNTFNDEFDATPNPTCSLREAIRSANTDTAFGGCIAGSGADSIRLPAGTYVLSIAGAGEDATSTGDLDITSGSTVTIDPTGVVVIDANGIDRAFDVLAGGSLTIADLSIREGNAAAGNGGGVLSAGTLTLGGVTLTQNQAANGGALAISGGTAGVTNVTISGNQATADGGGVVIEGGSVMFQNATIVDNTADSNSDDTGNGGGILVSGGSASLMNTILADNRDQSSPANLRHSDCSGTVTSQGYNLIEDTTGCTIAGVTTGNITGKGPQLGPLANNGGPTPTHLPRKASPVINAGNGCAPTDQRGVRRPQGPRCDIGAVEVEQAAGAGPQCLGKPVTITGTSGNDVIVGTNKPDVIQARGGDDLVDALRGKDRVCAGDGNDRVRGRSGNDIVTGQSGNDRVIGHGGDDSLRGRTGRDRIKGKGGNDVLRGGAQADRLNGGAGFDVCAGGPGRDVLRRCERRS